MLVFVFFLNILIYALILLCECEDLKKEALKYRADDVKYMKKYKPKQNFSTRLKYVLLWTRKDVKPFPKFGDGQNVFMEKKCPQIDCYVTNDRKLFGGDLKKFDAIAFNGRNLDKKDFPRKRYTHQKYIYVNEESASNFPVCSQEYENYFNWTYTYKLNSDILLPYIEIRNKNDEIVGPKPDMKWIDTEIDNKTLNALKLGWQNKQHAVAWMVSRCTALNRREFLVLKIKNSLQNANLSLAIYGRCLGLSCPKERTSECWKLLERKFYFYLSFENSNCEDYVTEKLLNPLQHYVIPIVYGGANYTRFLPPGSYLDASKLSPNKLVAKIKKIMSSFAEYMQYFKWRSAYNYSYSERNIVCGLCSALHNKTMMNDRKSYKKFRAWWFPNYRKVCKTRQYPKKNGIYSLINFLFS